MVGIALSGGAARCIAQIGVLEVFRSEGIRIGALSGTSGGALVGALFAFQQISTEEMIQRALSARWRQFARPAWSRQGFLSGEPIAELVRGWLGPVTFADLPLPFAAVASNLLTGERVVIRQGDLATAIQASCSLAVVFEPTLREGRLLVDGGYTSQIPVLAAREALGAKFVLAVDVNYRASEGIGVPKTMLASAIHLAALWCRKNADAELAFADGYIGVDARGIGLTDLKQGKALLERGRRAAWDFLRREGSRLPN